MVDWPLDWPSIALHGWGPGGHTCVPNRGERSTRMGRNVAHGVYTFRRYKVHGDTRWGCVAIGRQIQPGDKKLVFFLLSGHITSERSELRLKLLYGVMN